MSKQLFILLTILFFASCTNRTTDFEREKARVLRYFSAPQDSLKRQAALFLFEHIHTHYSSEHKILQDIEREYAGMTEREGYTASHERFMAVLRSNESFQVMREFCRVPDTERVTARFIIDNINQSFDAWQSAPWAADVDFETFLEFILPYRVMDEPLDFDRLYFREKYLPLIADVQDMHEAFNIIIATMPIRFHRGMDREFPFLMGVGISHRIGIGSCLQQSVTEAMILRSVGIPATVQYLPHWGNLSSRHYAVKLIDGSTDNVFHLSVADIPYFHIPPEKLPEGIPEVRFTRSVPKVYRMMWSVQPERAALNTDEETEQYRFLSLHAKDVTDEYTATSTFTLPINDAEERTAFLNVFNPTVGWIPVAATLIENGMAVFENVGREVVFLPMAMYSDPFGEMYMEAVGNPFYFTSAGELVTLSGTASQTQTVRIFTRYPMHAHAALHVYRMMGGRFQGANRRDFSDAIDLFVIDYFPFYRQEVTIRNNQRFRYFRYLPPPRVIWNFAELQFFTRNRNNELQLIQGEFFERHATPRIDFSLLSDNDLTTFVRGAPLQESWIAIDAGESLVALSSIVFATQNDGNSIVPDILYELWMWYNGDWKSLGEKEATKWHLEYENVPVDALLWLRAGGGRDERIFTFENGRKAWW